MSYTESEAATKWCPETRVAFIGNTVANRLSTSLLESAQAAAKRGRDDVEVEHMLQQRRDTHCIGSRCMMWEWAHSRTAADRGDCGLKHRGPDR